MNRKKPDGREVYDLLRAAIDAVNEDEAGISMMDGYRMKEFQLCCDALRALFDDGETTVVCTPHDQFSSVGTISVRGKRLVIRDPDLFAKATGFASNYEFYARTDGDVMLELIFYNLTRKVANV